MFSPEFLTFLTIIIYLSASITGICGMIWQKSGLRKIGQWLALGAFACQTIFLIFGFHALLPHGLSMGAYLQLFAWFFLLFGIIAWLRVRKDAILLFASPIGLFLFLLSAPWINLPLHLPPSLSRSFYALHIGSLFLSLGLLTLAFMSSIIFLFLQKRIKSKKPVRGFWDHLPPLSILDRINSICALTCYPLYTIGLIAGICYARPVFGSAMNGDPKEIVSFFIWLLLTLLFYNRVARSWKGKKPAIMITIIFFLSFFSIFFVNLYLPTHHGFIHS